MYKAQASYITGRVGSIDLYPWVTHPPHCGCSICPANRKRAAERSGRPIEDVWAEPLDIRMRRDSPFPRNRKLSKLAAIQLKESEETKLREAVQKDAAARQAELSIVRFGAVVDAYRQYFITNNKGLQKEKSRIDNIEAFISRNRDTAHVDIHVYRELIAEVERMHPETRRHYASTLLAMLNLAKDERVITSHQLLGVRVPQVIRDEEPQPWSHRELRVIMGPAMREYEREQAAWNARVAQEKKNRGLRSPSYLPLRGLSLVAYYTLMRPKNNRALEWEVLAIDTDSRTGFFKLNQHKNVNKGIKARGALAAELVDYLLSIRPPNACGPVHLNPSSGLPYVDIRKQWDRLIEIASRMLGYELTGKKADFFNFRHTGASHIAQRGRDPKHLLVVVKMMGDTCVETVNRHYFNLDDEVMQELVTGWEIPDVDVFAGVRSRLCAA